MKKKESTRKQLDGYQDLRKFHIAVEQAGDAIFITDRTGVIEYINPAFEKLTGYTKEEAIGKTPRIVNSGQQSDAHYKKLWNTILAGKIFRATVVNKRKSGELFYADHTITPLKNEKGDVTNFVAIWKDITEYKEMERRKDEFLSIASHELKTPITVIKIYADLLTKRLIKNNNKKNLYILSKITTGVNTLLVLVNDLLDINRIEDGKLHLNIKKFNLEALIERIVVDFEYITESHEIKKFCLTNTMIEADEERISQVLTNFLTNAIRYSSPDSEIHVLTEQDKENIRVSVRDFGKGIPRSEQKKIFERFYRMDNQKAKGFGIGLYVCADIIKRHGGRIWVESTVGRGSTFSFSIPIKYNGNN